MFVMLMRLAVSGALLVGRIFGRSERQRRRSERREHEQNESFSNGSFHRKLADKKS
jgi:hypothetical protein